VRLSWTERFQGTTFLPLTVTHCFSTPLPHLPEAPSHGQRLFERIDATDTRPLTQNVHTATIRNEQINSTVKEIECVALFQQLDMHIILARLQEEQRSR